MRLLIHRSFEVAASRSLVWDRLARPASWPSWARHIRAVDMDPEGLLTATSSGVVRLKNLVRSRFVVTAFVDGEHWLWTGRFLWLRIEYDHVLEAVTPGRTRITFDVSVGGFGSGTLGRFFAWVYRKSLDRAIPNLAHELESAVPRPSAGEGA